MSAPWTWRGVKAMGINCELVSGGVSCCLYCCPRRIFAAVAGRTAVDAADAWNIAGAQGTAVASRQAPWTHKHLLGSGQWMITCEEVAANQMRTHMVQLELYLYV